MLGTVQDLVGDFEIIPGKELSQNKSKRRFFNAVQKDAREFIQPDNKVVHKDLRCAKIVSSAGEVREFVKKSLDTFGFSHIQAQEELHDLAYNLMNRFNINTLNCRMDLVYSDKCKRFHVDNVYLRSITTLIGPGTELQMTDEPEKIYKVRTGDTVIVKGTQFPGEYTRVLHRSPKISHLGTFRIIFVMDY